jgi:hypothetical protein
VRAGWRRRDGHRIAATADDGRTGVCGPVFGRCGLDSDTNRDTNGHGHPDAYANPD